MAKTVYELHAKDGEYLGDLGVGVAAARREAKRQSRHYGDRVLRIWAYKGAARKLVAEYANGKEL
jgi:hypothetical protein